MHSATLDLAGSEIELVNPFNRERRLRQAITDEFLEEQGFDYLIIDCPPSLGLLTLNSMTAAPRSSFRSSEFYALEGVTQLLNNADDQAASGPELHISAVLPPCTTDGPSQDEVASECAVIPTRFSATSFPFGEGPEAPGYVDHHQL